MPVLNEATLIAGAVDAIGRQPGAHELIVVDGGSWDGTCEAVAHRARSGVQLVRYPVSAPPDIGGQINLGATHAGGDILMFLHCDVLLPSGAVEQVSAACANPRIVGGGFLPAFSRPVPAGERLPLWLVERVWQTRTRALRWFAGDTAPFIRADVFKHSGGYPTTGFASDWDFAAKLQALGPLTVITSTVRVDSRRHVFNGVFKTLCVTGSVELMYRLGVDRHFLRTWYRKWLPRERQSHVSAAPLGQSYVSEKDYEDDENKRTCSE
jgi:glycosyltransferase involved in cell wall biosynthesis